MDWLRLNEVPPAPGLLSLPLRLHACSARDLEAAAPMLRVLYRCARVQVSAHPTRPDRVTLLLLRNRLPVGSPLQVCSVRTPAARPLPLSTDDRGVDVSVSLFDPLVGGSSALVAGVPGAGKTTALRVLLAGLATSNAAIAFIDPAGGNEGTLWSDRLGALVATAEPEPTLALLDQVLRLIHVRGELLGRGAPLSLLRPVLVVCDELAELAAAGTPKQQEDCRTALRRITALGRKANVAVLLATQRTTATSIDVTTRSLVAWRVALAHPGDPHGSEAALGPGRSEAASLTTADRGAAFVSNGGPPVLVRVHSLEVDQVPLLARSGRYPGSLDELEAWEQASLREFVARRRYS